MRLSAQRMTTATENLVKLVGNLTIQRKPQRLPAPLSPTPLAALRHPLPARRGTSTNKPAVDSQPFNIFQFNCNGKIHETIRGQRSKTIYHDRCATEN